MSVRGRPRRSGLETVAVALCLIGLAFMASALPAAAAPTEVRTLGNGLRVAVFSDHRVPLVQIQLLVPAGTRDEQPLEAGVARVAALMLAKGTSSRSAVQFAMDVERLGGSFAASATRDFASLSGAFRAADLERGLELIADATINPVFDAAVFRGLQRDLLRGVVESRGRPAVVADEHAWAAALGSHPYARPEIGPLEGLAALSRDRVMTFHRECYRPDRALLAVAGDVDVERALRAVEDAFGRWAGTARSRVSTPPPAPPGRLRIRLVDVPGAAEAEIRLALPTPSHRSEDAYALTVLNDVLGAGPWSRLGDGTSRVLRYSSRLQLLDEAGLMLMGTSARNDSVKAAIARLRGELSRLRTEPPTDAEVERSRRAISKGFPIQNETIGARAAQWLSGTLLDLGDDYGDRYPGRIAAVTTEAVRAVASRVCDPDRADLVVVGAAAALESVLEALGAVEVLTLGDAASPVAVAPAMRMDEPDDEAIEQGRRLVQQAVAAHGGLNRLKAVRDSRTESEITLFRDGESINGQQTELRREPGQLRVETFFLQLSTVQALHGDSAWSHVSGPEADSTMDEGPEGVADLRHQFESDIVHLLLAASDPGTRVAYRGEQEVHGLPADVVETMTAGRERRVLFLDRQSHRVVAVEQNEGSVLRGPSLRRQFGDLRPVQGIVWPHFEERLLNGERTVTITVRSIRTNSGIVPSVFRKPGAPAPAGHPRR